MAISTVNSSSIDARLAGQSWRNFAPQFHVHLFSVKSLRQLAEECALSILYSECEGIFFNAKASTDEAPSQAVDALNELLCLWRVRGFATKFSLREEIVRITRCIKYPFFASHAQLVGDLRFTD